MTNDRARALLEKDGVVCEAEPAWITEGRKPDFYCSKPVEFWCEVKTFDPPKDSKALGAALTELRNRAAKIPRSGEGIAYVAEGFDHGDAKLVMNLAKRALARFDDKDDLEKSVALVPRDPVLGKFVRFRLSTKDHKVVEFNCAVSSTGKYGGPFGLYPDPPSQKITLHFSSGETKEVVADQVIDWYDDFRVAVVMLPNNQQFDVLGAMPTGMAKKLDTANQIRALVNDANDQFKNAIKYKAAPGVLVVFHDGMTVPDEEIIKSALYGDLKYVAPKDKPHEGKMILDENGAWKLKQNTTTSAVMYVRNQAPPLLVHNYWAERPLPTGLFDCKEIKVGEDGGFRDVVKTPPDSNTSDSA